MVWSSTCAPEVNALWQVGAGQLLTDAVAADVCKLTKALGQAEGMKHCAIDANADRRVAFLNSLQGGARRKGSLGHQRHWQAAAAAGVAQVCTQLVQLAADAGGREVGCRHM
jgi:hypothetical protein